MISNRVFSQVCSIRGHFFFMDKIKVGIEIIDYKTGKRDDDKTLEKSLQLSIYLLAATDPLIYNEKPDNVTLSFYFLQTTEKVSMKKTNESLNEIKSKILEIAEKIQNTDWTSTNLKACNRCSYCFLYSDTQIS